MLFEPAEATPFRDDIFNDYPGKNPEIDLLLVKAIKRSSDNVDVNEAEDEELAIKHGEMILGKNIFVVQWIMTHVHPAEMPSG